MSNTNRKVILVEDNEAEAKLTKIAFEEYAAELELVHCASAEELLYILKNSSVNEISYVLLDLNMPRFSGIEVLEKLKENAGWKSIPTIIFTSSAFEKDILTCYDLGANAYVVKPVEYELLEARLKAIHAFWGQANKLPTFPEISGN